MRIFERIEVSGPLRTYVTGFAAELTGQGYTDLSVRNQIYLLAHLSRWLEARRCAVDELTPALVSRFVASRRQTHTGLVSERALQPLLRHLRRLAVIPQVPPAAPRTGLLGRYERYLVDERDVLATRREYYLTVAAKFLHRRAPARLTAAKVSGFITAQARRPGFSGWLTAVRSLLRFLFLDGTTAANLVYAVPSAPHWRQASLPKALESATFKAVLATCDRRTTVGCRDYAALVLMGRLGLRAGEVAALTFDDFDWAAGEVVVHGKGGTVGRLPLPTDVGQAVVAYLRRRQQQDSRTVLLQCNAPHGGARASTITALAGRALRAAGVPTGGGHRLRHTAATQMLRQGASLTEIAQVLRHRHVDTTAIYAKVDHEALRTIAQAWPSGYLFDDTHLRPMAPPWPGGES